MRLALTGTPGTGKTTVSEILGERLGLEVVHLNQAIKERFSQGYDEERDVKVADIEAVKNEFGSEEEVIVEGHLAHHIDVDLVVVLRCRPDVLKDRLLDRGYSEEKVRENAEAEALDVIVAEAVEERGEKEVYEIDTTDTTPEEVVSKIVEAVEENRSRVGVVDWLEFVDEVGRE